MVRVLGPILGLLLMFGWPRSHPSEQRTDFPSGTTVSTGRFDTFEATIAVWSVLAVEDFDNDGDPDVVTVADTTVYVYFNQGGAQGGSRGSLQFEFAAALVPAEPRELLVGDLDGDLDQDVFVRGESYSTTLINRGGEPGGTIGHFRATAVDFGALDSVVLADLDNDTDLDAAISIGNQVRAAENPGNGELFMRPETIPGTHVYAAADVDGDDLTDLAVSGQGSSDLKIIINQGSWMFDDSGPSLGPGAVRLAFGELDGNPGVDALVARSEGFAKSLQTLVNDGAGLLTPLPLRHRLPFDFLGFGKIILTHLTPDSALDAVVLMNTSDLGFREATAIVLLNDGGNPPLRFNGQCLSRPQDASVVPGIGVGDFFSEGINDLLVVSQVKIGWIHKNGAMPILSRCCTIEFYASASLVDLSSGAPGPVSRSEPRLDHLLDRLATLGAILLESVDLDVYRWIQQQLLPDSPSGQRYLDFFDTHDEEIFTLSFGNQDLVNQGADTLGLWQHGLAALRDGQGSSSSITQEQIDALDDYLTQLEVLGSPALRQDIASERAAIPPLQSFVGKNMTQAQRDTIGIAGEIFYDGFESGDIAGWSSASP